MTVTLDRTVAPEEDLASAAGRYWAEHRWHTTIIGNQLLLDLRDGTVGISMSAARAAETDRRLRDLGVIHPIVPVPGPRPIWMFLAEERAGCLPRPGSTFLALVHRNTRVSLPPSRNGTGRLDWVVPPEHCADGVPALDHVLRFT